MLVRNPFIFISYRYYCAHTVLKQIDRLIVFMHISIKSDLMSDNVVQLRILHVLRVPIQTL